MIYACWRCGRRWICDWQVCLSVCHKSDFSAEPIKVVFWRRVYPRLVLHCAVRVGPTVVWNFVLNSGLKEFSDCSSTIKCCQLKWTLSVINWRRSSVASLSRWASTFVYNTMGVTQRVRRVCQRQLKLVGVRCRLSFDAVESATSSVWHVRMSR